MCCDNTIRVMNDFLDKTLSKNEEREVKNHLGECETCRREYQNLEKADNTLRQVVCKMVADIDVPLGLSDRIEKIISVENRRKTLGSRILMLLKTPAIAAALLFVVLAAGFLTYNNYFNLALNQKVALSEKDTVNYTDSGGTSTADKISAAVDVNKDSTNEVRVLQADSDLVMNSEQQLKEDPVGNPVKNQLESKAGILSDQPSMPAVTTAPMEFSKSRTVEDQKTAVVTSAPLGMGDSMPASNRGTMEEAVRDVGFIPAKPVYLPLGAVLSDVSWLAGETSQNYRVGRFYFAVSQNRLDAADFENDETFSQGAAVNINGLQGFIEESRPEPGGTVSETVTTLRWRQGDWAFSVSGDLPAEEIIKISTSIN